MGNIQKYPLQSADLPLSPPEQYHNGTCLWIHGWKQMHPIGEQHPYHYYLPFLLWLLQNFIFAYSQAKEA